MGVSVNRRTFLHRPIQRARLKAEGSKSALGVKKKKICVCSLSGLPLTDKFRYSSDVFGAI